MNIAGMAQSNYFSRPPDQRFESITDLEAAVRARTENSSEYSMPVIDLAPRVVPAIQGIEQHPESTDPRTGAIGFSTNHGWAVPSYHAFGQICSLIKAPARHYRELPPQLVTPLIRWGLTRRHEDLRPSMKFLSTHEDSRKRIVAVTSETYGRIWDLDVVHMTQQILERTDHRFYNPPEWSKKPGGLYASDEDVFMFFIDGGSIVEGGGDTDALHRGFFIWNSEVGKATMGIATFLFRMVCGNYGIFGMQDQRILRIRHTSGGPERFVNEAVPALKEYVNASAAPLESMIRSAKAKMLPTKDEDRNAIFLRLGISLAQMNRAKEYAEREEGQFASYWDAYNGVTAIAREIGHADSRVALATKAGKLIDLAA